MKRVFSFMVLFSFLVNACNQAGDTYSMFDHKESMEFYESRKFNDKKFDEYRIDEVLVTIAIAQYPEDDNDDYFLWVKFYSSNKDKELVLNSVSVSNGEEEVNESLDIEMTFVDDSQGLNKSEERVFSSIDRKFFEPSGKALQVKVEYELNSKSIIQIFEIDEHKYLIPIH